MRKIISLCLILMIISSSGITVSADYSTPDFSDFPESYRPLLTELCLKYPSWSFEAFETSLSWADVMEAEQEDTRNLVPVSSDTKSTWKVITKEWFFAGDKSIYTTTSGSGWVQASDEVIAYFMDPRNFLTEDAIFQFELLSFNPLTQTLEGVEQILNGTFMHGQSIENGLTYAQAIIQIAEQLNVSSYHLASRLRQEQGVSGNPLITGNMKGYEGYYNYFNIGASGTTDADVYANGIKTAKENGWDTQYKALYGGAEEISKRYIARGQDTLYLQKFDVDGSFDGLYWHQYMQNLQAAYTEGLSVKKTYTQLDMPPYPFTFKIPVFEDMPQSPCPRPEGDSEPVLSVKDIAVKKESVSAEFALTNSESKNLKYTAALLGFKDGVLCGFECKKGTLQSGESAAPKITLETANISDGVGFIWKEKK